jgi:uncharacterized protein
MIRLLAVALCLGCLAWVRPAAAVVDCSKVKSNVERLICSSDRLSVAEREMALAFRAAFQRTEDKEALIREQEQWRSQVRDACNDVPCLLEAYRRRAAELQTY